MSDLMGDPVERLEAVAALPHDDSWRLMAAPDTASDATFGDLREALSQLRKPSSGGREEVARAILMFHAHDDEAVVDRLIADDHHDWQVALNLADHLALTPPAVKPDPVGREGVERASDAVLVTDLQTAMGVLETLAKGGEPTLSAKSLQGLAIAIRCAISRLAALATTPCDRLPDSPLIANGKGIAVGPINATPCDEGDEQWRDMDSAPKDGTPVLLWAEADDGDRGAGWSVQQAAWYPGGESADIFGEEGGWLISCTDARPVEAVNPKCWRPQPTPPGSVTSSPVVGEREGWRRTITEAKARWDRLHKPTRISFDRFLMLELDEGRLAAPASRVVEAFCKELENRMEFGGYLTVQELYAARDEFAPNLSVTEK